MIVAATTQTIFLVATGGPKDKLSNSGLGDCANGDGERGLVMWPSEKMALDLSASRQTLANAEIDGKQHTALSAR